MAVLVCAISAENNYLTLKTRTTNDTCIFLSTKTFKSDSKIFKITVTHNLWFLLPTDHHFYIMLPTALSTKNNALDIECL